MQPEIQYGSQSGSLSGARNTVLRNTYLLLALTMVPTVIGAFVGISTGGIIMQHPIMATLLMIGAIVSIQVVIFACTYRLHAGLLLLCPPPLYFCWRLCAL